MAPTIASDADNHLGEVFNVMGEMRTSLRSSWTTTLNDMKTCLRQLIICEERYEDEMDSNTEAEGDWEGLHNGGRLQGLQVLNEESLPAQWSSSSFS